MWTRLKVLFLGLKTAAPQKTYDKASDLLVQFRKEGEFSEEQKLKAATVKSRFLYDYRGNYSKKYSTVIIQHTSKHGGVARGV